MKAKKSSREKQHTSGQWGGGGAKLQHYDVRSHLKELEENWTAMTKQKKTQRLKEAAGGRPGGVLALSEKAYEKGKGSRREKPE